MKRTILMLAFCTAILNTTVAETTNAAETAAFDKVFLDEFEKNETGAVALVARDGKIIYEKVVGKANIELDVPMQTNNVFRIASVTKQFTAIAILQLMEKGKLSLQDEITRFIPDYPVKNEKITIENLLTHTSGISDYSMMKDSNQRGKKDFTPEEMVRYFQNEPLRFAPGSRHEYSNSNYFLLGYIIEKITGNSYQHYLEDNFFKPLGMNGSYYASHSKMIKNRAAGYTQDEKEIENARYLSMTQPYAAGAIMSTVKDLYTWQMAVQSYRLVKKESLEKAYAGFKLPENKTTNYGYGWRLGFIQESQCVWHGGLINGYMPMAMYLPKEDVYVVILSNCDCISPEDAVVKLAAIAIGKPYDYKEITLARGDLESYAGVYENASGEQRVISVEGNKLYSQRERNPKVMVRSFQKDKFYFDNSYTTMAFTRDENGKADMLKISSRTAIEVWTRTDKPIRTLKETKVDENRLELYAGEYEVTPDFSFVIMREKDRLFLLATGQEKVEIFAESQNKFYLKVNGAQLEFVSKDGKVTKAILREGDRMTDAKKIK